MREAMYDDIAKFEKENHCKVVFCAMVGSISKGMQRVDSDYDTRFLYLDYDENGEIIRWDQVEDLHEKDIHKCTYPDEVVFFDKVAYWELTSFLHFLIKPCLDGKYSVGLYNLVNWTFESPYIYDPYGLRSKLFPLISMFFNPAAQVAYYKHYIENCYNEPASENKLFLREYCYSSYYAMAINFCMDYNKFPPIDFNTLVCFCRDKAYQDRVKELTDRYYDQSRHYTLDNMEKFEMKMANLLETERDEIIDEYINNALRRCPDFSVDKFTTSGDMHYYDSMMDIVMKYNTPREEILVMKK